MKMKKVAIYRIVNVRTRHIYVGQSINAATRLAQHQADLRRGDHCNERLQRAWNKYGPECFDFGLLEDEICPERLTEREQFWIDMMRSSAERFGYNLCPAAGSCRGFKHTAETIAKRSGRAPWNKGKVGQYRLPPASDERKEKIGAAQRGEKNHNFGKKTPDSVKEKCRASYRGSQCHLAKLNEDVVLAIKKALVNGVKVSALASQYGVATNQIYCIKRGKTWKHVIVDA